MKLIFCLAKDNSMMFFGKRQSKDELLREWLLDYTAGSKLWMSEYSANQFDEKANISIDDNYIIYAGLEDYCLIEDKAYNISEANEIVLCKWNRAYPGDKFLNIDLKNEGFNIIDKLDIKGKSHEKITIEIYKRMG